ncbi:MAG: hypothetical protein KJO24_03955 [Gammaproteobacteria bacterium]|nr:hypothetical protein [Gammaproteobacteria bacterium]
MSTQISKPARIAASKKTAQKWSDGLMAWFDVQAKVVVRGEALKCANSSIIR